MFQPLAYTKTFAMGGAAILSITLVPVLILLLVRGRIPREENNLLGRILIPAYRPLLTWVMRWKAGIILAALAVVGSNRLPGPQAGKRIHADPQRRHATFHARDPAGRFRHQGRRKSCRRRTRSSKAFPEVASVFGKAGRANTATDPAPLEMTETIINLKPPADWRAGMTVTHWWRKWIRHFKFRESAMPGPCR